MLLDIGVRGHSQGFDHTLLTESTILSFGYGEAPESKPQR
jgi:hypothetical protein